MSSAAPSSKNAENAAREDPLPYELRLRRDARWAMSESTKYFDGTSKLHETLHQLARSLDELGVEYAVVGGLALTAHGYARMTEDIDVLISAEHLKKVHAELVGRGYKKEFAGAKNIRDTTTGVKIEFVLVGHYPGSGREQPVSFPAPSEAGALDVDGVRFIGLPRLVELKLASGMTGGPNRAKDLVDVQQLIQLLRLPRPFAAQLHEYVRAQYEELWDGLRATTRRYVRLWRNKFLTLEASSLDDMIGSLSAACEELRRMKADAVVLDAEGGTADDYARLVTTDPAVAAKYDMHDEAEFFGEDGDD